MYFVHPTDRHSIASITSSWSSPTEENTNKLRSKSPNLNIMPDVSPPPPPHQRSRQASTCSERSTCEAMSADETRDLWRCMLALQRRYGCYTSARIDMALEAGEDGLDLMPSRFVIDTLNESVVHLPDEGREMLHRCLAPESFPQKPRWKFWKRE